MDERKYDDEFRSQTKPIDGTIALPHVNILFFGHYVNVTCYMLCASVSATHVDSCMYLMLWYNGFVSSTHTYIVGNCQHVVERLHFARLDAHWECEFASMLQHKTAPTIYLFLAGESGGVWVMGDLWGLHIITHLGNIIENTTKYIVGNIYVYTHICVCVYIHVRAWITQMLSHSRAKWPTYRTRAFI